MNGFLLFASPTPEVGLDRAEVAPESRPRLRAADAPRVTNRRAGRPLLSRMASLVLLALAVVVATPCLADVYKWVDKNGVAHYADQPPPPPQMDVQTLKDTHTSTGAAPGAVAATGDPNASASPATAPVAAPAGPAAAPAAAPPAANNAPPAKTAAPAKPQSFADKELEFRKRRLEAADAKEKQAKVDAASARKEENCRQQRARVATIREGGRLIRYNDKGERVDLSDADRESELRSATQSMEAACK